MKTLYEITPEELRELADIKDRMESILGQGHSATDGVRNLVGLRAKLHWSQTPEGRAKIARAQHRRWRKARR